MTHDRRTALRVRRAALDLTQIEVAKLAGMHMIRYSRIENCIFDPTPAERKAIARVLKAKADDLFPELVGAA